VVVAAGLIVSALTPFWNIAGSKLMVAPEIRSADAIVVLGGGILPDGSLTDESLRRTFQGFMLYKRGLAATIVLSGPARRGLRGMPIDEAATRAKMAVDIGIPVNAILEEAEVNTTRDEAVRIKELLGAAGRPAVLLVTESLHMRRAKLAFELAGFDVFPAPSDDFPAIALSPSDRIFLMWRVLQETGGLIYYWAAGYI
jgi:uncharacterized SAM-binding protein YcdF (DUF218 family)